MKIILGKNTHSMAELTLLVIFFLGLVAAWFIVAEKTRISFSEPIELEFTGLSASVPDGDTWVALDGWRYNSDHNLFFLSSDLRLNNKSEIFIEWQYLLAEPPGDIAEKLKSSVSRLNGTIVDEGRTDKNDLQFVWVKFAQTSEDIDKDVIVAIAELPSGRHLKLILRIDAQSSSLDHIYQSAIESVKYQQNELLDESSNFVVHLKSIGALSLAGLNTKRSNDKIYLLKRSMPNQQEGGIFGYSVDRFEKIYASSEWSGIKTRQLVFRTGLRAVLNQSDFLCDDDFTRFQLSDSQQSNRIQGSIDTVLESDQTGQMTVTKKQQTLQYCLSNSVVPEILIDPAAAAFLDYDDDTVLIELLSSDGMVVPTLMSKVDVNDYQEEYPNSEEITFVISLQYLFQPDTYEYFMFDSDKNIIRKRYTDPRQGYIYESTNWTDLLSRFPNSVDTVKSLFPETAGRQI